MALEDLTRYESSAVAALNVEKEKDLAVLAMRNQYKIILGKDFDTDPIIQNSLKEAAAGANGDLGITNFGIAQAIGNYQGKYEKAFNSTKLSDLTKYLTEGYKIDDSIKAALGKYAELTIEDLGKKAKESEISEEDKESITKVVTAITILKTRRLRARTMDMYNDLVKDQLSGLYPKEEKKEEGKK